jgi:hypothetical protein
MLMGKQMFKIFIAFLIILMGASCSDNVAEKPLLTEKKPHPIIMDVYKTPTCGCCKKWIDHIDEHGFQSNVVEMDDVSTIKKEKGIQPRYRSCHTAVSAEGFIFEGHVPAKFIQQFLLESHDETVIGLSVPAMPVGSPGMEVGDKFQPYKVLLLTSDGAYAIYANVQTYDEQF